MGGGGREWVTAIGREAEKKGRTDEARPCRRDAEGGAGLRPDPLRSYLFIPTKPVYLLSFITYLTDGGTPSYLISTTIR